MLAGMSVEDYVRLERGNLRGVSDTVLAGLAGALRLSPEERRHLMALAASANTGSRSTSFSPTRQVRPALQQLLDAMTTPAWVRNGRSDFLTANAAGRALYAPLLTSDLQPPNTARFLFLDPGRRTFYPQEGADRAAAGRLAAGRDRSPSPRSGADRADRRADLRQ